MSTDHRQETVNRRHWAALYIAAGLLFAYLAGCQSTPAEPSAELIVSGTTPTPAGAQQTVYILKDGTSVYDSPSQQAVVVAVLDRGAACLWLSDEGEWSKIRVNETKGYVQKQQLSENEVFPAMKERFESPRIVVNKGARELWLYDGDTCYGRYAVGLGWDPEGEKQREGDGKTPEGTYYVCCRNANSSYYLSLGVSYPNAEDAARGLEQGLIDENTYQRIYRAIERGGQPPWDTALGGEIMIHGGGWQRDWTAGCIAVDEETMDILWRMCPTGTEVEINP